MESISHYITSLVINGIGSGHTHIQMLIYIETILKNWARASRNHEPVAPGLKTYMCLILTTARVVE